MPRLAKFEDMYERYRFNYVNIAYKSGSGTATTGNVAVGVLSGKVNSNVKDLDTILKLKPAFFVPVWKNDSLTLNKFINGQMTLHTGLSDNDSVAFTLYTYTGTDSPGMLSISYSVEFSFPKPF